MTFPKYKFWTRFTKKLFFTRHMGGRIGSPKMTFKKSGYIKIVQFELVLPVLHNFFNFWDKITKPGNYWDYISFYNSQKLLSFWIYTFYRIEIWNRANFMIFGPFSAFGAGLCARPVMPVIMTGEIEKWQVKLMKFSSNQLCFHQNRHFFFKSAIF